MAKLSAKAFYSSQMEIVHQAGRQLQKWIMLIRLFPIYCSVMPTSQQPHCQTYGAGNPLCATRRLVKLLQYYRRFAYFLIFLLKRFAYFLIFLLKRFAYFLIFLLKRFAYFLIILYFCIAKRHKIKKLKLS